MDITFTASIEILIELSGDSHMSPEDFLLWLEDQLERGELTLNEVQQFITDYNQRN